MGECTSEKNCENPLIFDGVMTNLVAYFLTTLCTRLDLRFYESSCFVLQHAATVAVVSVLYLWRTGLQVAKHTYRYSSARVRQLKTSGHYICHQRHLRGAYRASCRMWAFAKSAGYLDQMCDIKHWKRRLYHISGVDYATSAVSHLGCRHKYGKSEHKCSMPGKSTVGGDHFRRKLISRKSMPCLNGAWPHMKRTVSWGELVHLNDERCSTVLKQYNHRVIIVVIFYLSFVSINAGLLGKWHLFRDVINFVIIDFCRRQCSCNYCKKELALSKKNSENYESQLSKY